MKISTLLMTFFILFSSHVQAGWKLSSEDSSLKFVTIKKNAIAEVHSFHKLNGFIKKGKAEISIDLMSVETNIPVRNERMQSMLFEVDSFPKAQIESDVSAILKNLKKGKTMNKPVEISLDLHGNTKKYTVDMLVTRINKKQLLVVSKSPVIINASDFSLTEGVEKLREAAKLPSISPVVSVTFDLLFEK